MDSITQITLGAAVGEVVLGRKVGNRAMVWGAIAGTIPDLDVLASLHFGSFAVAGEMSAMAFHRGFTHSLLFPFLAAPILGFLIHRIYADAGANNPSRHIPWKTFFGALAAFYVMLWLGAMSGPIIPSDGWRISGVTTTGVFLFAAIALGITRLRRKKSVNGDASWRQWSWLFFWCIITHPLLDAFTTYGTQLLLPFTDKRVAWNTISVADPLYTVPFLLCLLVGRILARGSQGRRRAVWAGLVISSLYLLGTVINKIYVNRAFERSLQQAEIPYERVLTTPTIFNNVLWSGVAETDTAYHMAMYSIFDETPYITFDEIEKGHHLLAEHEDEYNIRTLKWFSKGYYNVLRRSDGQLQFSDLRFGRMSDEMPKEDAFVFRFFLEELADGTLSARAETPRDRENMDMGVMLNELWERMKGRKNLPPTN